MCNNFLPTALPENPYLYNSCYCHVSHVRLFATLWTIACQALLSMVFSRQEYSHVAIPTPGDLPNPGIKPGPLISPALAGEFFTSSVTWESLACYIQATVPSHTTK